MDRGRRRAAGAARPRLADVRPHPAQGSRALHPLGRRDAHRSAIARSAARSAVAADPRQPLRADDDLAASDAARRRGDRQARRHHPRVRQQQREAAPPRRSARPRRRIRAQRHRRAARRPAARRSRPRAQLAEQLRAVGSESTQQDGRASASRSASSPNARAKPTDWSREATDRLAARLAEIESAGSRRRGAGRRGGSRLLGSARRAARPHLGDARRNPLRASTPRRRRSRRWSSRPRPGSARPAPKRRKRSRPTSTTPTRRSKACRAASPSRNARRSG